MLPQTPLTCQPSSFRSPVSRLTCLMIFLLLLACFGDDGLASDQEHLPALPKSVQKTVGLYPPETSETFQLSKKEPSSETVKENTSPTHEEEPSATPVTLTLNELTVPMMPMMENTGKLLWKANRPETGNEQQKRMTRSPPPRTMPQGRSQIQALPDSDRPPLAGSGTRSSSGNPSPGASKNAEGELKSMPKEPQGATPTPIPPILLDDLTSYEESSSEQGKNFGDDSNRDDDWLGSGDSSDDMSSDHGNTVSDSVDGAGRGDDGLDGAGINKDRFPSREEGSPWTVAALLILATVSTGAFLCMLYIAQDYRRRWLSSLMSQSGIVPSASSFWGSPYAGSSYLSGQQDGFYEFPFSTRYDD